MSWIFAVVLGVMIGATLRRRSPVPTGPSALRLQRLDARIALLMEHLELRDDAPGAADAFTRIERSVDHLLRNLGLSSADSAPALPPGVLEELEAGRKIEAIKRFRDATGCGLKEAKEAIDELERELRDWT